MEHQKLKIHLRSAPLSTGTAASESKISSNGQLVFENCAGLDMILITTIAVATLGAHMSMLMIKPDSLNSIYWTNVLINTFV
jgi:hypothetical protein